MLANAQMNHLEIASADSICGEMARYQTTESGEQDDKKTRYFCGRNLLPFLNEQLLSSDGLDLARSNTILEKLPFLKIKLKFN